MEEEVKQWADYVIERWEHQVIRLGISASGQLLKSFESFVITQSGGDVSRIEFIFEYYGKFVDMGVGRGVTFEEVAYSNRKPKPWYNKVFFSQVMKLGELLSEKYANQAKIEIVNNIV